MTGFGKPWIHRAHPNLFYAIAAIAIYHAWSATISQLAPEQFSVPGYVRVNALAGPRGWGIAYAAVAVLLVVGQFRVSYHTVRVGLCLGLALNFCRFALILQAQVFDHVPVGTGPPAYFVIALMILVPALEPPTNPATAKPHDRR